ncbi:MAG: hypothetical protein M3N18_11340 [Actinomycetota bacterium]|nr:hypothetical protein [Actinomycetota bacterium]
MRVVAVFPGKTDSLYLSTCRSRRLLVHPVRGLDGYGEMMRLLIEEKSAIKVFVEVGSL